MPRQPDCGQLQARFERGRTAALSRAIRAGCEWTRDLPAPKPCEVVTRTIRMRSGDVRSFQARQGDCPPLPKRPPTVAQAQQRALMGEAARACKGTKPAAEFRLCVRNELARKSAQGNAGGVALERRNAEHTFDADNGVRATVAALGDGRYRAAVVDLDSGRTLGVEVLPSEAAAVELARKAAGPDGRRVEVAPIRPAAPDDPLAGIEADIPLEAARAAHRGTSWVPDERARQVVAGHAETLRRDYERLRKYANTPEKLATLNAEFSRYRANLRRHQLDLLGAQSRVVSPMIAGPSKFPTARNNKRADTEDRRREEYLSFRNRALEHIEKVLRPELRPIMAGDSDATARLREKIEAAERDQARMKAANATIRKHAKGGRDAQIAALAELGFSAGAAAKLLEPDWAGRQGFAAYELTNNGANIRRMKQRLEEVSAAKATEATELEGANARIEDSPADNRIRLFFPGKPDRDVIGRLKSRGFRWTPSLGAWQAYRNTSSLAAAREFAGVAGSDPLVARGGTEGLAQVHKLLSGLPENHLIEYPSTGRWAFVGNVDARLSYLRKDGSELDEREAATAARSNAPGLAFRRRSYASREEALEAARSLGFEVRP